jgi:hypothetical protein
MLAASEGEDADEPEGKTKGHQGLDFILSNRTSPKEEGGEKRQGKADSGDSEKQGSHASLPRPIGKAYGLRWIRLLKPR